MKLFINIILVILYYIFTKQPQVPISFPNLSPLELVNFVIDSFLCVLIAKRFGLRNYSLNSMVLILVLGEVLRHLFEQYYSMSFFFRGSNFLQIKMKIKGIKSI